jgi:hypothetical protein
MHRTDTVEHGLLPTLRGSSSARPILNAQTGDSAEVAPVAGENDSPALLGDASDAQVHETNIEAGRCRGRRGSERVGAFVKFSTLLLHSLTPGLIQRFVLQISGILLPGGGVRGDA